MTKWSRTVLSVRQKAWCNMKGRIFEIKRFAVHDGDGIRTTVFLKGCPLSCLWCHNPEGLSKTPQLGYYSDKCIHCGACVAACPAGAHGMAQGRHVFDRTKCTACGACREACLGNALVFYGRDMTVEELLPLLLEDREFFENSGGGVTLSGGECLLQADFCAELLKALKAEGIHTAVDTCGAVPRENFEKVIPFTDVFLYDIKAISRDVHKNCTGVFNQQILENLRFLDEQGAAVEIRIPYVPGYNDGEMEAIGHLVKSFKQVKKVRVLPYHPYAGSKYRALGMENKMAATVPKEEEIKRIEAIFA